MSTALPDYKRPSAESRVYFFETEQEALVKLKQIKASADASLKAWLRVLMARLKERDREYLQS